MDPDNNPVYYNAEELLVGYKNNFTKWSNNAGKFIFQIIIISLILFAKQWGYEYRTSLIFEWLEDVF